MARARLCNSAMMRFIQRVLAHSRMLNQQFMVAWVMSPILDGVRNEDDFGTYIMGGEL